MFSSEEKILELVFFISLGFCLVFFKMPPIITSVVNTSDKEKKWHCYAICSQHAEALQKERLPDCIECSKLRIYRKSTIQNYISGQEKRGLRAPEFVVETSGFKSSGLYGDPRKVYQYVKFKGFRRWEYVCLGSRKTIMKQNV
jgi:hypothetical protein